ncbi:transglycosylase domain-containing protein [Leptospira idonii]|uniref:peptidoglycan glycosyltransferase n=1 Tax=Leptospira idonii TaxID=1193500 RepID=A0A4R9LXN1_9LEPT|nr:transglycosylase domain-containing protein [Leptospira idonii]TGN19083.1 carboxypeptidase [Leptospira idonii]
MSIPSPKYICPHCSKASRLPQPLPESGLFQLTCAHCKEKAVLKFDNYQFSVDRILPAAAKRETIIGQEQILESSPPVPSVQTTTPPVVSKPLFERKVLPLEERSFFREESLPKRREIKPPSEKKPLWFRENKVSYPKQKKTNGDFSFLKFIFGATAFGLFLFILVFAYFIAGVFQIKKEIPGLLVQLSKNVPTKILDRNGNVVSEIFQKRTSTLRLQDYPEDMVSILLNIEDQKFFSHGGIDYFAIIRAFSKNIANLSYKQGASTITQQLARIIIDDRRKSLTRKIREAQLAFALESLLSKEEILETYMNHVYLGHGAFGFGEGIKFYFHKNPQELSREEILLLASLPSAPNKFSPLKNPEDSYRRVRAILAMFRNRGIYPNLQKEKFVSIYHQFSTRSPNETVFGARQDIAPYVTEHIRSMLSVLEGDKNIYESGGYTVETTLDRSIQEFIGPSVRNYLSRAVKSGKIQKKLVRKLAGTPEEKAIKQRFDDIGVLNEFFWEGEINEGGKNIGVQAAVVGIQPGTGEILFLHGGEEFNSKNQFNRAVQMRRQTGSSIKAVLYASAIDSGVIQSGSRILDAPLYYRGGGGKEWSPDNLGGTFDGEISLRTALIKSKNTAAVQVAERLGAGGIETYFTKFFFPDVSEKKSRFRADLSLALGSLEISPLEMASAFTSFVNQGTIKRPFLIKKITNARGVVLYQTDEVDEFKLKVPKERQAIRPDTAEVMISLLKDSGRASGVRSGGYAGDLVGKTGTTNDYKDAWFVGARPELSLAVWIGYDDPKFGMGGSGLGGALAAPLWGEIVNTIDKNHFLVKREFAPPIYSKPYKICPLSGKEAGPNCAGAVSELYLSDYPPAGICSEDHKLPVLENRDLMKNLF